MATAVLFNDFPEQESRGNHDFGSDAFYWCLTNTAPNATDTVLTDITQIAAGNGYTAGGAAATSVTISETGGTVTVASGPTVFTASAGDFAAARYAVLYNFTSASKFLVGYVDHGSSFTITDGNTYTINDTSATIFTKAV